MRRQQSPEDAPIRRVHDWPSFFEVIRTRTAMWIGHNSVTALECTLLGISYAEEFYQIPKDRIFGGFDWAAFEAWIEKTYNPRRLSVRSFGLARYLVGDEERALALWFEWYDEFRETETGRGV